MRPGATGDGDLLAVRGGDGAGSGESVLLYVQGPFLVVAQGDLLSVGDDVSAAGDAGGDDDGTDSRDERSQSWAGDEQDDRCNQLPRVGGTRALLSVRRHSLIGRLVWLLVWGLILGSRHRSVFWVCFSCRRSVASQVSCRAVCFGVSAGGSLDAGGPGFFTMRGMCRCSVPRTRVVVSEITTV